MKRVGKIISVFFFTLVFLLLVIVGTLRFEVLNSSFVFGSLQRNGVYEKLPAAFVKALPNDPNIPKEEREDYSKIALSISPKAVQKAVETNLLGIFDFLNGKSKDVSIFIPSSGLGVPGGGDIRWSFKDAPKGSIESLQMIYGIGNKLLVTFIVLLILLVGIYKFAGRSSLLTAGIIGILLGGVGRLFLLVITTNTPMKEPAQVLLVFLSSSILSDIVLSWLLVGIILISIWFILKRKLSF